MPKGINFDSPPKDELYRLYWEEELSLSRMAEALSCSQTAVFQAMRRLGVPRRSLSQAVSLLKGPPTLDASGREWARKHYGKKPCRVCGRVGEIHHKDGNALNNEPTNIEWLCRRHHIEGDGRLSRLRWRNILLAKKRENVRVRKITKFPGYFVWSCGVCGAEYPLRRDASGCCWKQKEGKDV